MHRFFVPKESLSHDTVSIREEIAHQIYHVLRLKPGDQIIVLDNSGYEYQVRLEKVNAGLAQGKVIGKEPGMGEPKIKITLFQALLKSDKLEFVLQKGVELGVSGFVPFISERSAVRKPGETKFSRWQNIVREAAEQSRRALLPALRPVVPFREACSLAGESSLILWESETSTSLASALKSRAFHNRKELNLMVGPEGGFAESEIEYAKSRGIISAGMGPRILRAETAGLVAISAILYEKGEFS